MKEEEVTGSGSYVKAESMWNHHKNEENLHES